MVHVFSNGGLRCYIEALTLLDDKKARGPV